VALRSLALCAGIGGLDLGIRDARPDHCLVGVVERQAYCAAVLVARMADKAVDAAPIWDDLRTFDPRPWRGVVDLVTAGFPCQPVSVAGLRLAQADERWLWPEVWRITRGVGARYLFVENVSGLISAGLTGILADLAEGGWDAEWDCVPAAAVGAPHLRDRFFLLAADANSERVRDASEQELVRGATVRPMLAGLAATGRLQPQPTARNRGGANYSTASGRHAGTTLTDAAVRDASGSRLQGLWSTGPTGDADEEVTDTDSIRGDTRSGSEATRDAQWADASRGVATDAERARLEGQDGERDDRAGRTESLVAERVTADSDDERDSIERTHGSVEGQWAIAAGPRDLVVRRTGTAWPSPPEPTFRRVDDGSTAGVDGCPLCAADGDHCRRHALYKLEPNWAERIHALGNAVVPQAASRAFTTLWKRLVG
jgi:site-specific DNA-cytosine methylase